MIVRVSGPSTPPDFISDLPGSGPIRNRDVRVGSDLIANLTGPDFNIVRVGGDDGKRTLATGAFVEWQWDVQPLHSGQKELSLILFVRLTDGGPPVDVKIFTEKVDVKVNPIHTALQVVKDYWSAITAVVSAIFGGAVWMVRRWRRTRIAATPGNKPAKRAPNQGSGPVRDARV
ncbi:MAG: hypothetical protein JO115_25335 [Pseudonocardiales bacterium]|nr:hypothetical protein [Pseudonocardiales bacterium]